MKLLLKLLLIVFIVLLNISCDSTEPTETPPDEKPKWEVIPELENIDVRYIIKHNNTLFLTGLVTGREYRGEIWKTADGENWTIIRTFEKAVGPLAINGDSLFCLGDSLFRYIIPLNKWENVCQPYPLNTDVQAVGEMIFLENTLYAMQTLYSDAVATYRLNYDGSFDELLVYNGRSYGGAKFIKKNNINNWCYVRGQYYKGGFYRFDTNTFTILKDGLTDEAWLFPATNTMEVVNDTLFAGFRYPGIIMYLDNDNEWKDYTDSIPCRMDSILVGQIEPTEITFINEKLYTSTDILGIFEWGKNTGWINISAGLKTYNVGNATVFYPIVFLENVKEILIAAYGAPGYAPWGRVGAYRLKVE